MKGTNEPKEHTETELIRFDTQRGLSQSENTSVSVKIQNISVKFPCALLVYLCLLSRYFLFFGKSLL